MEELPPLVIMTCYARSGGTLLNRCLSALPGVMMFSEVSPLRRENGVIYVKRQAKEFYNLELRGTSFSECVQELYEEATRQKKTLILRDWPFCCFEATGRPGHPPTGQLELEAHLPEGIPTRNFAFVRDCYDIFLSRPWGKGFLQNYLSYTRALLDHGMPIYTYEAFCENAETVMQEICQYTGLHYDAGFLSNFTRQTRVTGDVSLGSISRGGSSKEIMNLPRRLPTVTQCKGVFFTRALRVANQGLGYPTSYFSRPLHLPWRKSR